LASELCKQTLLYSIGYCMAGQLDPFGGLEDIYSRSIAKFTFNQP
jgi:hypothetical protein